MSLPIWVTDPAGNNNPRLVIIPATFIANIEATFDGNGNFLTTATLYYSTDGINWPAADLSKLLGFPELSQMRQFTYGNGMWMCTFRFTYSIDGQGNHLRKDVAISTTDGVQWTPRMTANENLSTTIQITWNAVNNNFSLNNGGRVINIANPNATPIVLFGDFISHGIGPMANPGTVAAQPNNVLQTNLPGSFTAVRYGFSGNPFNVFTQIDLTTTPITTTIVNSGAGWPAASWTTVFDQDPSGGTGPSQTGTTPAYGGLG